jgi:DNA repair exonuclease SbcCD ATPase subunit
MIKIKNLTVKNFMSVGNQTQAVSFDKGHLTLVLGENLDLGGDGSGSRNGTGKTTIINGLSYAIYGNALTNIKKDNLVNKINSKAMLVTMSFEKDGIDYKIERGRKPNLLKFTINGLELKAQDQDESQGDSRETQKAIEEVFGMTHDMFKHILALNTYTEPFLSMKAADQRAIIEQLLGITILSEKADALKEGIRINKDLISQENTKIETIKVSNDKIQLSIDSLERKQKLWLQTNSEAVARLNKDIKTMQSIDIDKEIADQRALIEWNKHRKDVDSITSLIARQQTTLDKEQRVLDKLDQEILLLAEHKCHSCGQDVHDEKHETMVSAKQTQRNESSQAVAGFEQELAEFKEALTLLGPLADCPKVTYDTLEQALNHKNTLDNLEKDAKAKAAEADPYQDQVDELKNTAVQVIDWDNINNLTRLKDHQEFLLKLLTNKDSFIRKKIIDQNLSFLNNRLTYYLDRI